MELNLVGTKGYYTVRDGSERVTSETSIVASYANVVNFGVGFSLLGIAYYGLSSLSTSFNAQLGSFSLAIVFFGFLTSQFVTPSLMDVLGAKTCAVGSGILVLLFSISYFYPTWYTLMPSSLGMGLGYGLLYAASGTIKNDEVRKCVERFKVDPLTYQGRFSAIIITFGLGASAMLAGVTSLGILSSRSSEVSRVGGCEQARNNSLVFNTSKATQTDFRPLVSPTVYYILVATMTAVSLLCIFTMSIMRGAAYHKCKVRSFGLKEALRNTATHAVKVLKQACTPAYGLVLPLRLNQGFTTAFFYGVFTKRYITECVGVQYIGVAICVRGVFATLGSFGSGWLMQRTTSYMMVLVCIGGLEVGSLIFLIVWERQPSFAAIIIITAIIGLCYGLNATVGLAYSGTAPGDTVTGYSAFVMEHTAGQVVQFFVSEYISAEANLFVILVITILAVPLFTIADIHYGSGTSRNICGKKKAQKPVVVENRNIQRESVCSSLELNDGGPEDKLRIAVLLVENGRDSDSGVAMNSDTSPPRSQCMEE